MGTIRESSQAIVVMVTDKQLGTKEVVSKVAVESRYCDIRHRYCGSR